MATVWGIGSARADATRQIESARADSDRLIEATRATAADEIEAMRKAADDQIAAARAELDASDRPLLIEVFPTGPVYPDMGAHENPDIARAPNRQIPQTIAVAFQGGPTMEVDPRLVVIKLERAMAYVSVPLRNVGRGLAVIEAAEIKADGAALGARKANPFVHRVRVPVGETTRVELILQYEFGVPISRLDEWRLQIPYTDFAGRQWIVATIRLAYAGENAADGSWAIIGVDHDT